MFAYVGGCQFHVRFFKEDHELATINKEWEKKLKELMGIDGKDGILRPYSTQARR